MHANMQVCMRVCVCVCVGAQVGFVYLGSTHLRLCHTKPFVSQQRDSRKQQLSSLSTDFSKEFKELSQQELTA